jgi:hypothetical protein
VRTVRIVHFCIKTIILPRQAQDKHREENSKKKACVRCILIRPHCEVRIVQLGTNLPAVPVATDS